MRTPARDRRLGAQVVALVAALLLVAYAVRWITDVDPGRERGTDFSATYVAGLLWRHGDAAQLYDQGAEAAEHATITLPGYHTDLPFLTAPSSAVAGAAFTALDPGSAFRLFSLAQLMLVLGACAIAAAVAGWPPRSRLLAVAAVLAATAGVGSQNLLLLGQWDGVNALGLALLYAGLRRDHAAAGGAALAVTAMLAKPNLAAGVLLFLAGRREWRAVAGAAGAGVAMLAVWLATTGVHATLAFPGGAAGALEHSPPASMLSVTGFVASWLGRGTAPGVVTGVLVALALAAAAVLGDRGRGGEVEPGLAGATALALLASPHLLEHDLVLLAPAFVALTAWAARRDAAGRGAGVDTARVLAGWVAVNVCAILDLGAASQAPPGRVVPLALAGVALVAWRVSRQSLRSAEPTRTG